MQNFTDIKYNSPIPKIIHKIWMTFNPENTQKPEKYVRNNEILKSLHPDWFFMEWNDQQVLDFVATYYPEFFSTYINYPEPIMRHDASRYLILNHFGGIFIQDSFVFNKNIQPLLGEYKLIVSKKTNIAERENELSNGIIASTPNHPFWQYFIPELINVSKNRKDHAKNFVMSITGPFIFTDAIDKYLNSTHDNSIKILDKQYLMPFYYIDNKLDHIKKNCIETEDPKQCFTLLYMLLPTPTGNLLGLKKKINITS
jgi:mannosyltransferase OCH1-like enzyme